jgi:hypothetical protein
MKWYLAMLPIVLGLTITTSASASNWWLAPYGDATGIAECNNCQGDGTQLVVAHSVPSWSMTTKGFEYGKNFIIGSARTKVLKELWISSAFDPSQGHPCSVVGACTMYLCLSNVGCADVTSPFQAGALQAGTNQFAGVRWWGGSELWFAIYYQIHGSGPMLPVRTSRNEALIIFYRDG